MRVRRRGMSLAICLLSVAGCGGGGPADTVAASPDAAIDAAVDAPAEKFSFFVTSLATMRLQANSQDGFGGDLGGLAGADAICQRAATDVGFGGKTWRAFLSTAHGGPGDGPVHAIDRVGAGPWYDR